MSQEEHDQPWNAASRPEVSTNFADVVGKWIPDPAFDELIEAQRQIDPDKWKRHPRVE